MQQSYKVKCLNQNEAVQVCAIKTCRQPPLMCNIMQCQCRANHIKCQTVHIISSLRLRLEQKGYYIVPVYECLAQWYQSQVKFFSIKTEEVRRLIEDRIPILFGDEARLYKMISEGRSADVTSSLVSSVAHSLVIEPQIDIKDKINKLKKQLKQITKQVQQTSKKVKLLEDPSKYIPERVAPNPKFKDYLKHPDIQISKQGIIVKLTKSDNNFKTALLESPIESFRASQQIYKFRITKSTKKSIMFGFCLQKYALENSYINNYISECGGYVMSSNNCSIYTHDDQQVIRGDSKNTVTDINDVVHVIYTPSENKVQFKNIKKNKKDTISLISEPGNPIHLCVMLCDSGDQVEFLGLELIV